MFTHLHCHGQYSLLDGHCRYKKMAKRAAELGQTALAITEHGFLYGVQEFYDACIKEGVKPIIGCELYTARESIYEKGADGKESGHIVLLAKDNAGYHNLVKLCSVAAVDGYYYHPRVGMAELRKYAEGLICLSGCMKGDVSRLLLEGKREDAYALATEYHDIFGEDYYIEMQYHGLHEQKRLLPLLDELAKQLGIQPVATNDVHYVHQSDAFCQRVLQCIGMKAKLNDESVKALGNSTHYYLKTEEEMSLIFGKLCPAAISNTQVIADKCNVTLERGEYKLPKFTLPYGYTSNKEYFRMLCVEGAKWRFGDAYQERLPDLEMEMDTIEKMGFIDYFLIVADFIGFAKMEAEISIGPGRGSAAGSLVAYCLGITEIDPRKYGLVFERFLNPERVTMPDIDIDVDADDRDTLIAYIIDKYGRDCVSQINAVGTLIGRTALRDVANVLNFDGEILAKLQRLVPDGSSVKQTLETSVTMKKLYDSDEDVKKLLNVTISLEGLPRHVSTHAAGLIIAPGPITDYIPLRKDQVDGRIVSQFDMLSVEASGLLKVDVLGLSTLTVLRNAEQSVKETYGKFSLEDIPMDDTDVYKMISEGKTVGVFQFESSGMRKVLRDLKPTCLEDLIAAIALYRPGPMDSIPRFIECKHHPEKVAYLHPKLQPILETTYGCIVYQEQVMSIVRALAGYSNGRADEVRRAMAKKKKDMMEQEHDYFINGKLREDGSVEIPGCIRNGISADIAEKIWEQMADFAEYAFNKAHAAAYGILTYQTAYMRCHYPKEYMSALLTNAVPFPEKLAKYLHECEYMDIKILRPDINLSSVAFTVEGDAIRFGLAGIKETGKAILAELTMERNSRPFNDLQDLLERSVTAGNKKTLEALIKSGSLDCFPHSREQMLAVLPMMIKAASRARKENLDAQITFEDSFFTKREDDQPEFHFPKVEYPTDIEPIPLMKRLDMEMDATGMYISGHPIDMYREIIEKRATHNLCDFAADALPIEADTRVRIAGIITEVRKVTTKNKQQMAFVTIEDKTGKQDITVFPRAYEAYSVQLKQGTAILVFGRAEPNPPYGARVIADSISLLGTPAEESQK